MNLSCSAPTKKRLEHRTTTLKRLLIHSLAIGFAISTTLLILERITDYSVAVMDWEMPGLTAAFIFWGAVSNSVILGVAIAWIVNAIVYSVPAIVVLGLYRAMKGLAAR